MLSRREFLGWLAVSVPAASIVRLAHDASIAHLATDPETLRALGEAVLPSELGADQIRFTVAGFRKWIDGYRENAELVHAYGNSRIRFTGPTPATRWTRQLDDLDAAARAATGKPFSGLSVADRQAIVRPLLAGERSIPGSPDGGTHVAAALLGFFYSSALATDLCYQASIGRNTCRPLSDSPVMPKRAGRTRAPASARRESVEPGS